MVVMAWYKERQVNLTFIFGSCKPDFKLLFGEIIPFLNLSD